MSKIETTFLAVAVAFVLKAPLCAEITTGLLVSVESNAKMRLLHRNQSISCEPLGVIPLEKMPLAAPDPQRCRSAIEQWYRSHPAERRYGSAHLRLQQTYRFEKSEKGCVLYVNGPESYSEMLLLRGLALIDQAFDEREWNGRLNRAQKGGEKHRNGLHDTVIRDACFKKEE